MLKLSTQWGMTGSRKWAIANIEAMGWRFPAALSLRLGRQYDYEKWINPALRRLLGHTGTLRSMRSEQSKWLTFAEYELIACAREALENEKKLLALSPLEIDAKRDPLGDLKGSDCVSHQECVRVWKAQWKKHIGEPMLHPEMLFALSFDDAKEKLQEHPFKGMTKSCRDLCVQRVLDSRAFDITERFVEQAYIKLQTEIPSDVIDIIF